MSFIDYSNHNNTEDFNRVLAEPDIEPSPTEEGEEFLIEDRIKEQPPKPTELEQEGVGMNLLDVLNDPEDNCRRCGSELELTSKRDETGQTTKYKTHKPEIKEVIKTVYEDVDRIDETEEKLSEAVDDLNSIYSNIEDRISELESLKENVNDRACNLEELKSQLTDITDLLNNIDSAVDDITEISDAEDFGIYA